MAQYNSIIKKIKQSVAKLSRSIPKSQRKLYEAILEETKRFDTYSDGRIRQTAKNLAVLASIRNKINRLILTDGYKESVKQFAKDFNEIATLQKEYWQEAEGTFKPRTLLKELRKQAIVEVVGKLTEQGIGANVSDRVIDILRTNITSGGSYKDLAKQLRNGLTGKNQQGILERYVKQVAVDSVNQFSAQYTQIVSSDLGLEWFKYDNSDIDTTRPFCDAMTDQPYFHISQVENLLKAKGLFYMKDGKRTKVPLNPKTGLPNGMIPGTNAENFFVNRGGYNCGHQIRPIRAISVPAAIRASVEASAEYKKWKTASGQR